MGYQLIINNFFPLFLNDSVKRKRETKMKFEKYEGIKNTNHKKTLEKIYLEGGAIQSRVWCITEKVHGTHFDIAWDGIGEVEFWSRERKLPVEEDFYCYHVIRDYLRECIKRAYKFVEEGTGVKGGFELIVCGEIIGGTYPHKDVEKMVHIGRVQKGVFYTNDLRFYGFDVRIDEEFINYYSALHIMENSGFMAAQILIEGTFDECLEYTNEFQTTIPDILRLPKIDDNICEGVVLKPIKPERFLDGKRVILKNKNEKFSGRSRKPKVPREQLKLTPELNSVVSKLNKKLLTKKQGFPKLMGHFRKDIMETFNDDYEGAIWNFLDKQDKYLINKYIGHLCVPLVKAEWMEILEE